MNPLRELDAAIRQAGRRDLGNFIPANSDFSATSLDPDPTLLELQFHFQPVHRWG